MARETSVFDKMLDAASNHNVKLNTGKSRRWFSDNVKKIAGPITSTDVMADSRGKLVNRPSMGRLYFYYYNPKYKDTLPYYDRFPLVVVIDVQKTHFLGLNLHYLPPRFRATLLGRLLETANSKTLNEKSKLQITYNLLKSASKYQLFKPCIKKYLYTHVRSKYLKVDGDEWEVAIALPVETFAKASKQKVWKDSLGGL